MTGKSKGSWPFAPGAAPEPTKQELEAQHLAEQQKLIEVLKFTPRTYRVSLWGYGGEKVMGTVDKKTWNYCMENSVIQTNYRFSQDNGTSVTTWHMSTV